MSNRRPTPDKQLRERLVDTLLRLPDVDDRRKRGALLDGIEVRLDRNDNAFYDLTGLIDQLEGLGRLSNGERPIVIVARNARRAVRGTELGQEFESLAQEIEKAYSEEPLMADIPTQPEALVFGGAGEWVTSTFLEHARQAGTRVARMRVPRIVDGHEQHAIGGLGTGWLIGPRLVLTNHHVVNARAQGEPAATEADFKTQGEKAVAWFDYYFEGREHVEVPVAEVVQSNATYDYALLRLADDAALTARKPLPIPKSAQVLTRGARLNVVQYPGGGPLRFAIRNNFFVGTGKQTYHLRYLTDTLQGSSGSPVLDDSWQVVALHHGAQKIDPALYQAEPGMSGIVKFHNQGVDIHAILKDLAPAIAGEIARAQGWT